MNEMELFNKYDYNGNPIFYVDEECEKPYTGHLEEYDRGIICREADVIDGFIDGICKEYYPKSNKLEIISQMKYNLQNGLYVDFFENGRVKSIALAVNSDYVDYIIYDENGTIEHKCLGDNEQKIQFIIKEKENFIRELRNKYNLLKIHEEIVRDGEKFDYKKYFGL